MRWTAEQDEALATWWHDQVRPGTIGLWLGRSRKAVWARVLKLRAQGLIQPATNTYLPTHGAVVPCRICQRLFTRVRVTHGLCADPDCRRAARRQPHPVLRTDGLCPRCQTNPRVHRPDGSLRPWCGTCEARQKTQYMRTEAGKATVRRYLATDKGKAALRRTAANKRARRRGDA